MKLLVLETGEAFELSVAFNKLMFYHPKIRRCVNFNLCYLMASCVSEQRLITKEHIAMHTNLILPLYTPVL